MEEKLLYIVKKQYFKRGFFHEPEKCIINNLFKCLNKTEL